MDLDADTRWRRLYRGVPCSCGQEHTGMFELHYYWPDGWKHGNKIEPNPALRLDGDFLSDDFCVIEGKFFAVRTLLPVSLGDTGHKLSIVCWSSVTSDDFHAYAMKAPRGGAVGTGRTFGRLMNRLDGYPDTYGMQVTLVAPGGFKRPLVATEPSDHPLHVDQRQGIDLDRLFELYAANGHEMRPALVQAN